MGHHEEEQREGSEHSPSSQFRQTHPVSPMSPCRVRICVPRDPHSHSHTCVPVGCWGRWGPPWHCCPGAPSREEASSVGLGFGPVHGACVAGSLTITHDVPSCVTSQHSISQYPIFSISHYPTVQHPPCSTPCSPLSHGIPYSSFLGTPHSPSHVTPHSPSHITPRSPSIVPYFLHSTVPHIPLSLAPHVLHLLAYHFVYSIAAHILHPAVHHVAHPMASPVFHPMAPNILPSMAPCVPQPTVPYVLYPPPSGNSQFPDTLCYPSYSTPCCPSHGTPHSTSLATPYSLSHSTPCSPSVVPYVLHFTVLHITYSLAPHVLLASMFSTPWHPTFSSHDTSPCPMLHYHVMCSHLTPHIQAMTSSQRILPHQHPPEA